MFDKILNECCKYFFLKRLCFWEIFCLKRSTLIKYNVDMPTPSPSPSYNYAVTLQSSLSRFKEKNYFHYPYSIHIIQYTHYTHTLIWYYGTLISYKHITHWNRFYSFLYIMYKCILTMWYNSFIALNFKDFFKPFFLQLCK